MEGLKIEAATRTPDISFDSEKNILEIKGKSYPSNVSDYYMPVFSWLREYFKQSDSRREFTVNIELLYFNSGSSKVLLELFILLEAEASEGKNISINWIYLEDDEDNLEYGKEFQADLQLQFLKFNLVPKKI